MSMDIDKMRKVLAWGGGEYEKPSREKLSSLIEYYSNKTADLTDDWALEHLIKPDKWYMLELLEIADNWEMGKAFAILKAFKMGYLLAKGKIELEGDDPEDEGVREE